MQELLRTGIYFCKLEVNLPIHLNHIEQLYLQIIHNTCTQTSSNITISQDVSISLINLAQTQSSLPFLLPYIKDSSLLANIKYQTKLMMLNYYQIEQFTRRIADLFDANNISYILLKGISLAAFYPVPEYRQLGDVDIYINDKEMFNRANALLLANGYTKDDEISDHHQGYLYKVPQTGRTMILELHYRIVGLYQYAPVNKIVDDVFAANTFSPAMQTVNNRNYPVLPPTEYTFYMIHHMLKHYLYSGFGIRLLCDFTFFLGHNYTAIDFAQIHTWCKESKILHLYEIILETCRIYLGLPETIDSKIHYNKNDCKAFITQLLEDGDVSQNNGSALVGSGSYEKINFLTYFKEGHLQMHVRFPKLGKCLLLWPILWLITLVCFLYNNRTIRNMSLAQTLRSFKQDNQKSKLLRIFDNTDHK